MLLDKEAIILLADYKDIFFQTNPFKYVPEVWSTPLYQLVVFQESFPNKMIYRNPMNYGVLDTCYGTEVATHIGYNPVSCSGTVMGSRDGVLAYVSIDSKYM